MNAVRPVQALGHRRKSRCVLCDRQRWLACFLRDAHSIISIATFILAVFLKLVCASLAVVVCVRSLGEAVVSVVVSCRHASTVFSMVPASTFGKQDLPVRVSCRAATLARIKTAA